MTGYGVIIADPAWSYRNGSAAGRLNGAATNHYATMSTDQICALPVDQIAAPDSVLLMWCTWPLLTDGLRVMQAWGFEYVTGMPWVKLSEPPMVNLWGQVEMRVPFGIGWWLRGVSEPILIGRRGNAKPPDRAWCGLLSERFRHSRKPDNLHEYAESMPGPYLEMNARRPRPGWDVWGNEVAGSIQLPVVTD